MNILLTGRSVPYLPQSSISASVGFIGVAFWVTLLWGWAWWRTSYRGRGHQTDLKARGKATAPRHVITAAVVLGGASVMFAGGWLLPPRIVQEVPWRYTYQWLHDEAINKAPDDVTRQIIQQLNTSGQVSKSYFTGDGYQQTLPYIPQLETAPAVETVFNVTSARQPGEVIIFVNPNGSTQLVACLRNVANVWRIYQMQENKSCEAKRDG